MLYKKKTLYLKCKEFIIKIRINIINTINILFSSTIFIYYPGHYFSIFTFSSIFCTRILDDVSFISTFVNCDLDSSL